MSKAIVTRTKRNFNKEKDSLLEYARNKELVINIQKSKYMRFCSIKTQFAIITARIQILSPLMKSKFWV